MAQEREPIRGPILGWPFPILNTILELIAYFRARRLERFSRARGVFSSSLRPTIANVEVWEWTDYRGIKRYLEIHREVKE